ncbi:hypothetical protein [uncultured Fibrella sp.]|uniref:hypothetical protein n=1 Tax=uncultured Fibrella sp. TaxID=1284596 RepID=UPI0035C9A9A1
MKPILILCFSLLTLTTSAQDDPYETVFQRRANRQTSALKGYGMILTEFSPRVNPSSGVYSFLSNGLEGGVIINRRVRLGAYSLYTLTPGDLLRVNPYAAQESVSGYLQIGGTFAWLPRSEKPLHLTLGTRFGYGGSLISYVALPDTYQTIQTNGLLLTPHVDLEANLRPWLRASIGVGYRIVAGPNTTLFAFGRDFGTPVLHLGIQFGNFK